MAVSVSWIGALLGLALAIGLILKKLNPVYALLLGTIVGALIGGANLTQTVNIVVAGSQSVMGTVISDSGASGRCFCWCYDGVWRS